MQNQCHVCANVFVMNSPRNTCWRNGRCAVAERAVTCWPKWERHMNSSAYQWSRWSYHVHLNLANLPQVLHAYVLEYVLVANVTTRQVQLMNQENKPHDGHTQTV